MGNFSLLKDMLAILILYWQSARSGGFEYVSEFILLLFSASGDVRTGENELFFRDDFGKSALWRRTVNGWGRNKLYREVACPDYC